MKIYLKRNTVFTPIIFIEPEFIDAKSIHFVESPYYAYPSSDRLMYFDWDKELRKVNEFEYCHNSRAAIRKYYRFNGGLLNQSCNIIALIVVDNKGDKYVIVDSVIPEKSNAIFLKIKRSMKELGIDPKKRLILGTKEEIYKQFQERLNPTMEDYSKGEMEKVSIEFINYIKEHGIKKEIGID